MKVRVITIEREFGAGGGAIARKLSDKLGWKLWDEALSSEIAGKAHVTTEAAERFDERRDPLLYRLAKVFARGSYERSLPLEGSEVFDTDRMVRLVTTVIEDAASSGNCIVVGRGAPFILRNRLDAYHVFVYAPMEEKIRRLLATGRSEAEAVHLLSIIDKERAAFVKQYFGKDWPTRYLYHLWINSIPGDEYVMAAILSAISNFEASPSPGLATTLC
jgi:cytidylate kinase